MESLTSFCEDVNIINQINEESMILNNQTNPKTARKQRNSDLSHIIYRDRFRTLIGILLFFFVFLFPILVSVLDNIWVNQVVISIYIFSFLFLIIYLLIAAIFVIIILFQITYRTRCLDFFFQMLIYFQFIMVSFLLLPLIFLTNYVWALRSDIYYSLDWRNNPQFNQFFLIIHIFWLISLLIFLLARRSFRKPIFWLDWLEPDRLTIINKGATDIHEVEDGYSQRPLFLPFTEISDHIHDIAAFQENFQRYAKFIARKGEFIDWSLKEKSIVFYPRFLIQTPNILLRPIHFFKFWKNLQNKKELTTIELDYITKNLSIRVSSGDYTMLEREVTFHLLLEKILQSVKESMIKFLEGDLKSSYNVFLKI